MLIKLIVVLVTVSVFAAGGVAQQVQFPSTSSSGNPWPSTPQPANQLFPPAPPASAGWNATGVLTPTTAPGVQYGNQVLPNATGWPSTGVGGVNPTLPNAPTTIYGPATVTPLGQPALNSPFGTNSALNQPWNYGLNAQNPAAIYPNSAPPALFPGNSGIQNPFGANPALGSSNSIFPDSWLNGNNWRLGSGWFNNPNGTLFQNPSQQVIRFFQGPRLRHTWIAGGDPSGAPQAETLEINDTEASLAFAIPSFLGSTQPLYLVPSFSSHLWEGPSSPTADLPGAAYSAFLDVGWDSDPIRTFGLETGIRIGVFTDYETFNSESLRILGKLIGRVRLTPTATGKLGVYWVDRNRIKLVPAGGVIWTPNPDTRFDLFFPEPKLAHYLATVGRTDTWWYATGYFGGGTWTITRADGAEDEVDINDLRIMLGLEFGKNDAMRAGQRTAFIEAGYSFNRELIYRIRPEDSTDIEDSFVIRAGFGY